MKFTNYYLSLSANAKKELAEGAGTSTQYLSQLSTGRRNAGFTTIQNLIKADSNIKYEMFESAA